MTRVRSPICALALALVACAPAGKKIKAPKFEKVGIDEASGKGAIHSAPPPDVEKPEDLPEHAKPPSFSCCEKEFASKKPKVQAATQTVGTGNTRATEVMLRMKVPIAWACDVLAKKECLGTFGSVEIDARPSVRRTTGTSVLLSPTKEKVWWNEAPAACDGKKYRSVLDVFYVARFPGVGPLIGPKNAATTVKLTLVPKEGAGEKRTVTASLSQKRTDAEVRVTVTSSSGE